MIKEPSWVTAVTQERWPDPFIWTLARMYQLELQEMETLNLQLEVLNARIRLLEHQKGEEWKRHLR